MHPNVFDEFEHMRLPQNSASFIGGAYIAQFNLPAGARVESHRHTYDHASILASGEVLVITGDTSTRYIAPAVVRIAAYTNHLIIANKASVWFCVHAVDQSTEAYRTQDPYGMDGVLIVKEKAT